MIKDYFNDINNCIEIYQKRYRNTPKRGAFRVAVWSLQYLLTGRKIIDEEDFHPCFKPDIRENELSVLFLLAGGYGDYLLFANYLSYFLERFVQKKVKVYIGYHISSAKTIFNYNIENVTFVDVREVSINPENFDMAFHFCVVPKLLYADDKKIKEISVLLYQYLGLCQKYYKENQLILEKHPALDGWGSCKSIALGIKRIQEPDIYSYLGISEKYKYRILIEEDERKYLESIGLVEQQYIAIHRGWDGTSPSNVKAWSEKSCGDLIPKLKEKYPEYKLVLFGSDRGQAPKNISGLDIDLIGKTSLEQVKVLLKNAVVLIDNEGGMVHLRHALGAKPSIVLFGPTSHKLFGYSENINLNAGVCDHFCEWLTKDWPLRCPKGDGVPCMEAITTADVLAAFDLVIAKGK